MMTQGKKYSVSIMQTAHLDRKQPPNPYLHYAEQLEKAKNIINTSLLAACHKQNS